MLLSLFFSASGGSTGSRLVLLVAFAVLVARHRPRGARVPAGRCGWARCCVRLQDTTAEIRVRFAVVLLIAFTALAERFGLESILGAFLAGVVVGMVDRDSARHPRFRTKLEAIGFGFLIPVFFVSSGIRLDLQRAARQPVRAAARADVPARAAARARRPGAALPAAARAAEPTMAAGLLQATSLPFIVTATQIGVQLGRITPSLPRRSYSPGCCRC